MISLLKKLDFFKVLFSDFTVYSLELSINLTGIYLDCERTWTVGKKTPHRNEQDKHIL